MYDLKSLVSSFKYKYENKISGIHDKINSDHMNYIVSGRGLSFQQLLLKILM